MFSSQKFFAALEEHAAEVAESVVSVAPGPAVIHEDITADEVAIQEDIQTLANATKALEDILALVEAAPGELDQPLQPFVEQAVDVALEAHELESPAAAGDTKAQFIAKTREYAKKIWATIVAFAKKVYAWIRETWTKVTSMIVSNVNTAKKYKVAVSNMATNPGAQISDEGVLSAIATTGNLDVGDAFLNAYEFAMNQGQKNGKALAAAGVKAVALFTSNAQSYERGLEELGNVLVASSEGYGEQGSKEQAERANVPAGAQLVVSRPFFGGFRGWMSAPSDGQSVEVWNHGLSKLDEVSTGQPVKAGDAQELAAICDEVAKLDTLVGIYRNNLRDLDALDKQLEKAANSPAELSEEHQAVLRKIKVVIPRIVKGPQVAAYNYAGRASSIALRYVQASIKAHQGAGQTGT